MKLPKKNLEIWNDIGVAQKRKEKTFFKLRIEI